MKEFVIEYYDELESTNDYAKKCTRDGTVIVAESQTKGKGRLGRSWENGKGTCVAMSIYLEPTIEPCEASQLTLVAALAISEALGEDTKIKWPNDIVLNKKKLAGILTEMSTVDGNIKYVIVGIGINVNVEQFSNEIKDTATSLFLETGMHCEIKKVIETVLEKFGKYYDMFLESRDMSRLKEIYNARLANLNERVRIISDENTEGVALGIKDTGELIVRKDDGEILEVISGEVSVRGLYGYV